jgi:hypothetical protein
MESKSGLSRPSSSLSSSSFISFVKEGSSGLLAVGPLEAGGASAAFSAVRSENSLPSALTSSGIIEFLPAERWLQLHLFKSERSGAVAENLPGRLLQCDRAMMPALQDIAYGIENFIQCLS